MNETEHIACQQKKDEELLKFLVLFFLTNTASVSTKAILFCRYVGMPTRYICLTANSIYFRFAQTRYDINPRSRSEHIESLRSKHHIERLRSKHYIENPR